MSSAQKLSVIRPGDLKGWDAKAKFSNCLGEGYRGGSPIFEMGKSRSDENDYRRKEIAFQHCRGCHPALVASFLFYYPCQRLSITIYICWQNPLSPRGFKRSRIGRVGNAVRRNLLISDSSISLAHPRRDYPVKHAISSYMHTLLSNLEDRR